LAAQLLQDTHKAATSHITIKVTQLRAQAAQAVISTDIVALTADLAS
jgi:hypothetical protein